MLDRIKKKQEALEQVEAATSEAKRYGIETIHGFF
jgi:hypothetical protein